MDKVKAIIGYILVFIGVIGLISESDGTTTAVISTLVSAAILAGGAALLATCNNTESDEA